MKRFLLAALAVAAFVGIEAVPAQAYATLGPCILRAFTPNSNQPLGYNTFAGQGEIQCNSSQNIDLDVCLQQLVTGGWQNVYCTGWTGTFYEPTIWGESTSVYPVGGRWYRSWDEGYANSSYNTYSSSGVQG